MPSHLQLATAGKELELVRALASASLDDDTLRELLTTCMAQNMAVATHVLSERAQPALLEALDASIGAEHAAIRRLRAGWAKPDPVPVDKRVRQLFNAIYDSNVARVEKLLADGVPASSVNPDDASAEDEVEGYAGDPVASDVAFHAAVFVATNQKPMQPSLVSAFIDVGADINLRNSIGETPFHALFSMCSGAAHERHSVAQMLLDAGADATLLSNLGRSVLHLWALGAPAHRATFELLLEAGAPLDVQDKRGATALHLAIAERYDGRERSHEKIALWMLDSGANARLKDEQGFTPRMLAEHAAREGHEMSELIARLLALEEAELGREPAEDPESSLRRELLALGARRHSPSYSRPPQNDAAQKYNQQAAREAATLVRGIGPGAADLPVEPYYRAYEWAVERGAIEVVEAMLDVGVDADRSNGLNTACYVDDRAMAELLIGRGANLDGQKDEDGIQRRPLRSAVSGGSFRLVQRLIEAGAPVPLKVRSDESILGHARGPERDAIRRYLRALTRDRVAKSKASPLRFKKRREMYDMDALSGSDESSATYRSLPFAVVEGSVDDVVHGLHESGPVVEHIPNLNQGAIPANASAVFVVETTQKGYCFVVAGEMKCGELHLRLQGAAGIVFNGATHPLDETYDIDKSPDRGSYHARTPALNAWLMERELWLPPMNFVGDDDHDHGLQHELCFKGVKRDAIVRVDYLAFKR